jgi:hypothetical protein
MESIYPARASQAFNQTYRISLFRNRAGRRDSGGIGSHDTLAALTLSKSLVSVPLPTLLKHCAESKTGSSKRLFDWLTNCNFQLEFDVLMSNKLLTFIGLALVRLVHYTRINFACSTSRFGMFRAVKTCVTSWKSIVFSRFLHCLRPNSVRRSGGERLSSHARPR